MGDISVSTFVSWSVSGLAGITMLFAKMQIQDLKDRVKDNTNAIEQIRENYFKKEDFREFKDELWARLDKMEQKLKQ